MECGQGEGPAGKVSRPYSLYYSFSLNIVFRAQLPVKEKIFRLIAYMNLHGIRRASLLRVGHRELSNDYLRAR